MSVRECLKRMGIQGKWVKKEEEEKEAGYHKNGRSNHGCAQFDSFTQTPSPAPTAPGISLAHSEHSEAKLCHCKEDKISQSVLPAVGLRLQQRAAATHFLEKELEHAASFLSPHRLIIDIQQSGRKGWGGGIKAGFYYKSAVIFIGRAAAFLSKSLVSYWIFSVGSFDENLKSA